MASNFTIPMKTPKVDYSDDDGESEDELMPFDTFVDYKPSKPKYGSPHPDPVVESCSLSSVSPPDVYYQLKIPKEIIDERKLSALQLESIVYASQQHEHVLSDGSRAGFLIGDGTGVGKGRTIAGIIYENHLNRRERSVWFSVSTDLMNDAVQDFRDINANIDVHLLNNFNYNDDEMHDKRGVMFCTYKTLISKSINGNRYDQLIKWCGKDFDGVIVLDECHKSKNLSPTSGQLTQTALAVSALQKDLSNARVVYASATGATEPNDMGYMTRLGIWGKDMPYDNFNQFMNAVKKRGVGAMELVAIELKMRGKYIARQLSFARVKFSVEEVQLENEFVLMYNESVRLWVDAKTQFQESMELLKFQKTLKDQIWIYFWGSHQKFFKILCVASKVNHVIELSKKAHDDGKCVVIGLQSTGEAQALKQLEESEGKVNNFVSTAKGVFRSLIENYFPINRELRVKSELSDESDDDSSESIDETDDDDVHTDSAHEVSSDSIKTCIDMRDQLIEKIEKLKLPLNTLDQLIHDLGGHKFVAEITGRKIHCDVSENGEFNYKYRSDDDDVSMDKINNEEKLRFMNDDKRFAIISEAASTGISLHSDERVKNNRQRMHITIELPWSADRVLQQFGRTHRSNQVNAPEYVFLISELAGEKRFASIVAQRLKSLSALTQGDRRSTEMMDLSQFDVLTKYGRNALSIVMNSIVGTETPKMELPIEYTNIEDFRRDCIIGLKGVGLVHSNNDGQSYSLDKDHNLKKFLNRLLGIETSVQNALFQYFSDVMDDLIKNAKREDKYDWGITDLSSDDKNVQIKRAERFSKSSVNESLVINVHTVTIDRGISWDDAKQMFNKLQNNDKYEGFYVTKNEKDPMKNTAFMAILDSSNRNETRYEIYRPNTGRTKAQSALSITKKGQKFHDTISAVKCAWNFVHTSSLTKCSHSLRKKCRKTGCTIGMRKREYCILSGAVLSFWSYLEKKIKELQTQRVQIVRLRTRDLSIIGPPLTEQKLWPTHCVQQTLGVQLHKDLKLSPSEKSLNVYKGTKPDIDSYSAFWDNQKLSETSLHKELEKRNITDVFVCGIAYDICVGFTALHAIEYGYRTILIDDACRGISKEDIKKMKESLKKRNSVIVNSERVKDMVMGIDRMPQIGYALAIKFKSDIK